MSEFNEPWHVATNPGGPEKQPAFPNVYDSSGKKHGEAIALITLGNSETCKRTADRVVSAVNCCASVSNEELEKVSYREMKKQRGSLIHALALIAKHGGKTKDDEIGLSCTGSWCAEQATVALVALGLEAALDAAGGAR